HALLKSCCNYDASRLTGMRLRFSAPVYPGEILRTEIWQEGGQVSFRSSVPAREQVVLSNGAAEILK
ncbi:MAG: 3-alpha,7-alpha,12-alpha-trihydroxy-5-beta-cholest-24-enoyl-CoA hydratase, partial [Gammaproteobacteria bacterium]